MTPKLPPQSLASEKVIIASMLTIPDTVDEFIQDIKSDHFYAVKHGVIMSSIEALYSSSNVIDMVSVIEHIKSLNNVDANDYIEYISELVTDSSTNRSLSTHINTVISKYELRKVIEAASKAQEEAYSNSLDSKDVLANLDSALLQIQEKSEKSEPEHISKVAARSLKEVNKARNCSGLTGISTGFKDLNKFMTGFHPGELIVAAARPGMGKTGLVMAMARFCGVPCAVFSLEMPKEQLTIRLKSMMSGVPLLRIRGGYVDNEELDKINKAFNSMCNLPIHIDDAPALNIPRLRGKLRKLKKKYGLKLAFIDYLQLMKGHEKNRSREQEISSISRCLKELAKELGIAIVALSQLSRSLEQRTCKRPILSDLRESGAIEQDADAVLFIYRPEMYEDKPEHKGVAELIIGKQRNGPVTTVKVNFDKNTVNFYDEGVSPDPEEEF